MSELPPDNNLSLSLGRQISAWGQSEIAPVVDVVNPRNLRELGQTELDEMRLPVSMLKLNYVKNNWSSELLGVCEFRGNKTGVRGSDFDPYRQIRSFMPVGGENMAYRFADNVETYFRSKAYFSKGEFSLILADGYDKSALLFFDKNSNRLIPQYHRIQMIGLSGNIVFGQWLTKVESAFYNNKTLQRGDLLQQIQSNPTQVSSTMERDMVQTMLGWDYSGLSNTTLTIEWNSQYIKRYDERLLMDKWQNTFTLMLNRTLMNQRLVNNIAWFKFDNNNGDVIRFNVEYEYHDGLHFSLAAFIYQAKNSGATLYPYRNNDRVVASMNYYY